MPDEQVKTLAEKLFSYGSGSQILDSDVDAMAAQLKAAIDERIDEKTAGMKATLMFLTSEASDDR